MHGRSQLGGWLNRVLVGLPETRSLLSGWRRPFATLHAFLSVVFQVVWMGGLIIAIAWWAEGLGVLMAIVAATMWALLPIVRWAASVWNHPGVGTTSWSMTFFGRPRVRLTMVVLCAMSVAGYALTARSPFARRVPVIVRFHSEQRVRASADAFVKSVHVQCGQRVAQGTLLIELESPELVLRLEEHRDDLKTTRINEIEARKNGDLSVAAAESEHAESLLRQIEELETEVANLKPHAERDGLIIGSHLDSLMGRYMNQGDQMMSVCDPQEKELLASVGPSDIEAYQQVCKARKTATIRLRGGFRFEANPSPLRPRALNSLPHPALGANVGGPIAIEMTSSDSGDGPTPTEPQMESVTPLHPLVSCQIQSGQIGTMAISDTRSIATRVIDAMR